MVDFSAVRGGNAYDSDGHKVGSVDEVYTDKDTGEPSFVTVNTGLFGSRTTFVPLADATVDGNDVRLPYQKSVIKDAPSVDPDAEIDDEEQERLYEYYGLGGSSASTDRGRVGGGDRDADRDGLLGGDRDERGTVGRDTSGPTTDDAMTRSEERLRVGTRTEESGRARMRKYVTTERVSEDVAVSHEEIRVTREPITDANRGDAGDNPSISEEEFEVTLHAERAVADKEVVAVERVRLDTQTVRGTETVTGEVRQEHIEVEGATGVDTDRDRA